MCAAPREPLTFSGVAARPPADRRSPPSRSSRSPPPAHPLRPGTQHCGCRCPTGRHHVEGSQFRVAVARHRSSCHESLAGEPRKVHRAQGVSDVHSIHLRLLLCGEVHLSWGCIATTEPGETATCRGVTGRHPARSFHTERWRFHPEALQKEVTHGCDAFAATFRAPRMA